MFDYIRCGATLPMPEESQGLNIAWNSELFQTKSLASAMSLYTITKDGELIEKIVEHEYVEYTKEELATVERKPWNVYKQVIEKEPYYKTSEYHGVINFYASVEYTEKEDLWVEFAAYFICGKLDKIELLKTNRIVCGSFNKRENDAFEH